MTDSTTLGLKPGAWTVDPVHSSVNFSARHMMVTKVKGSFNEFDVQITVGEQIEDSSVSASIKVASIDTNNAQRDGHLKSNDFWAEGKGETIEFRSTKIAQKGEDWVITGDLTMNGVTKPTDLDVEFGGSTADGQGGHKAGFEGRATILRSDFGINFNVPMDGGGVMISDKIEILIDIEAGIEG